MRIGNGKKGKLKLFFGYAGRIGKTEAMLLAAQTAKESGTDVVIGYLALHPSECCRELTGSFELLDNVTVGEFLDVEAALKRKPELLLVDELACINRKNSRHRMRYQDVEELLKNGIDVYSTMNVGNIESLHDTVAEITGTDRWERIPDDVFDNADQVELIDVEPQEVIGRCRKEFAPEITLEQLTALREITLRRYADRVKRRAEKKPEKFRTEEHVLACLSSSPSNAKIIRTAARMARAFNSQFTALFVETPDFAVATRENKERLRENRKLAEQLGAVIETVYGEDVPFQIAEFARISGVTKIVLGRNAAARKHLWKKPALTEQLLSYVPEMDIHIIPDESNGRTYRMKKARKRDRKKIIRNIMSSIGIFAGSTLLSLVFNHFGFTNPNIIMVYILGVLLTSIATSHPIYSLSASIASVFVFNYLFTVPRFSLTAYETGYPVTFIVMFLTAYITGTLAIRYKEQAGQSAKTAHRTKILFDTGQLLARAKGQKEILEAAAKQITTLLERKIVIYMNSEGTLSEPIFFPNREDTAISAKEREAAEWVLKNKTPAGASTDTLSEVEYLYLAMRVNDRVYGVVGIEKGKEPPDASEYSMLLSILGDSALALENEKNAREKEAAAILAESEQLRANLLRTISHDLRTPLTSISGNASNLLNNSASFDEETKRGIYSDIYEDSIWLIDLVEKLLYTTRIEEGRMVLHFSAELLDELIESAVQHVSRKVGNHVLQVSGTEELLLIKADAKLIEQVIVNLIDNAIKYTEAEASISVTVRKQGPMAVIEIADSGKGISDEEKEKVFEKFYCGTNKIADNRRSIGLGLYLCKVIVEAHGGTIRVTDNVPHGAVFQFTLPLEEVIRFE